MKLRIRELREARDMTQAELADAARVRPATVSEMETGKGNPRLDTLEAIAAALRVSVLEIFEPQEDPGTAKLRAAIERLDPASRAAVETLIRAASPPD